MTCMAVVVHGGVLMSCMAVVVIPKTLASLCTMLGLSRSGFHT